MTITVFFSYVANAILLLSIFRTWFKNNYRVFLELEAERIRDKKQVKHGIKY